MCLILMCEGERRPVAARPSGPVDLLGWSCEGVAVAGVMVSAGRDRLALRVAPAYPHSKWVSGAVGKHEATVGQGGHGTVVAALQQGKACHKSIPLVVLRRWWRVAGCGGKGGCMCSATHIV